MRRTLVGAGIAAVAVLLVAPAAPAFAEVVSLTASGSGAEEVPGPGEAGATVTGTFSIDTTAGTMTYTVSFSGNAQPAVAGHIHRGATGVSGDVVVPLDTAAINAGTQATATVDAALAAEIAGNPSGFYLNVHSEALPAGFARGQLRDASPGGVAAGDGSSAGGLPVSVGIALLGAGAGVVALGIARRRRGAMGDMG